MENCVRLPDCCAFVKAEVMLN